MPGPDEIVSGLPEAVRDSSRTIVIYQGPPPDSLDVQTRSALGLLSWIALLTICLSVIGYCVWSMWSPYHNEREFSPIYAEGRPVGLAKQIEERRRINAEAAGLIEFLDEVRADNFDRRRSTSIHPLLTGPDGIDNLRAQWDSMCRNIRDRIYDRRIGQIEARISEMRTRRRQTRDLAQRTQIDSDLQALQQLRLDELDRRRTDSDPSLRCIPAAQAATCSSSNNDPWCNPQLRRPGEFLDEAL